MFDIGFFELIVISVMALLVLGPERLPKAAAQAGRWIGRAKRMMGHWTDEINRQIENESLQEELKKQSQLGEVTDHLNSISDSLSKSLQGGNLGGDAPVDPSVRAHDETSVLDKEIIGKSRKEKQDVDRNMANLELPAQKTTADKKLSA